MKITPKELTEAQELQKKAPSQTSASSPFSQALQDAAAQSGVKSSSVSAQQVRLPMAIDIPAIRFGLADPSEESRLVPQVEGFLDVIEQYQKMMENSKVSLKDIHSVITKMETETEKLRPVLDSLPDGSKMKDILNRVLVASSVEIIKYNRGDYL